MAARIAAQPPPSGADILIAHHARALKAPRIAGECCQLAKHGRGAGWLLKTISPRC